MSARLLAAVARIDALPRRERFTLLGGLLALAIGVQALWVAPARDKRLAIAQSSVEADLSRGDALSSAAAQSSAAFQDLQRRHRELEAKLAGVGLKATQREAVSGFVTRSLIGEGVRLAALTALPVEELIIAESAAAAGAAAESADPATPAATRPALFRHRAELRLEGPVKGVVQAIEQVERGLAPLRIERIRITPIGSAGAVQASLVLTTISEERTWLAL